MATPHDVLRAVDEVFSDGARRGMMHNVAEDTTLDGRMVTLRGRRLVNFGSCSYLGLETHPALRAGVIEATRRFGTQFSSSRAYLSSPDYPEAEETLSVLFGRPTLITPSTTMAHLAALPALIGEGDALVLDHQVHNSVQTAAKLVQAQGGTVRLLPHSNLAVLERWANELARTHRRVWYAADGLYSMYADFAPMRELEELLSRNDQLWLYIDDAHSVSWSGRHGRGHALEHLGPAAAQRCVVAASLNKSFAAAGGVLTFPDEESRRWVFTVGSPLIFSGPVQPPMLGAALASARLHLSGGADPRRDHLQRLITLFNNRAGERGLPLVSPSQAPIRCVAAGLPRVAYNVVGRLHEAGWFVDTALYPAVPAKRWGIRISLNAHLSEADVIGLVDAIERELPRALAEEGVSVRALEHAFHRQLAGRPVRLPEPAAGSPAGQARGSLRLEHLRSVTELRMLERAFAGQQAEPEHSWAFNYWLVREPSTGRPLAATFFTTALWKDDMLARPDVSAEVERSRGADPYHLTSRMVAMGSLLTEGDHLYLDRDGQWQEALRLILAAARAEEDRVGAAAVVLRDLPDGDPQLHDFLLSEGFLRIPILDTWERSVDFADDAAFLDGLSRKARYHQRTRVLAFEDRYVVRTVAGGTDDAAAISPAERRRLYALYRNVHARNLELNVFPLPLRLLDAVLADPAWELLILSLRDDPDRPVAFAVQHVGPDHVQPVFVGLDYEFVASQNCYQQLLWQSLRSASRRGAGRILLGMSAGLQKSRFGAAPRRRWVYLQPTDSYQADVLSQVAERVAVTAA